MASKNSSGNAGIPEDDEEKADIEVTSVPKTSTAILLPSRHLRLSSSQPPAGINAFSRLRAHTDLKSPPSNWLHPHPSGANLLQGFSAAPHKMPGRPRPPFSSFLMASRFVEFLGASDVDVVADAEIIKRLLKLPYARSAPVSLIVHRVGRSLLLDDLDIHGFLLRPSEDEWKWLKKFFIETVFRSAEPKEKALSRRSKTTSTAIQERNLISKFLYHSLEDREESSQETKEKTENTFEASESPIGGSDRSVSLPQLPEPSVEENLLNLQAASSSSSTAHEFARNLLWNFEDIRMLIGCDMPIFGDADHPSVSLRLHNADKPINVLTGLDYWLDNLMCQVPEVLMCYHLNGIVQKYELIKTEDLPDLKGSKFAPRVIRDVAKNILSFLKSNAAKEGHTYWLFKGKDDDVVKLYDLTSLCDEIGRKDSQTKSKEEENPFKTAVTMLLYKVARNIMQSAERGEEGGTVKHLLTKCLELLNTKKFPHIATSVHFMLSDLYVSDDTNPADPKLADLELSSWKSLPEEDVQDGDSSTKVISMQTLLHPHKHHMQREEKELKPSGSSSAVKDRCLSSLSHIAEGLRILEELQRRKEDREEETRQEEELRERANIPMTRPLQPVPMRYDDPGKRQVQIYMRNQEQDGESQQRLKLCEIEVTWHDHLKRVLLNKAFLVYLTLGEVHYSESKYGLSLKCIKNGLNCFTMARGGQDNDGGNSRLSQLSFAFGVAGDCYMSMVRTWESGYVVCHEQYNSASENDIEIAHQVEKYVEEHLRDRIIKLPRDVEEALLLTRKCIERSIELWMRARPEDQGTGKSDELSGMIKRLGNINNEVGVFYMNQATSLFKQQQLAEEREEALNRLFDLSMRHLQEGVDNFASVSDFVNQALLRANCGRLCRLFAFSQMNQEVNETEMLYYRQALDHYESALALLGGRRRNAPAIWDSLSWELSSVLFLMGTQLQEFSPQQKLSRNEVQKKITEYLTRSLHLCDLKNSSESGVGRQEMYQIRAATIHFRLGNMFQSSIEDDSNFGEKRSNMRRLAEIHYEKAARLFAQLEDHTEFLRVQLHRIALAELSVNSGAEGSRGSFRPIVTVLKYFADCSSCLKALVKEGWCPVKSENDSEEKSQLMSQFLTRLQFNLLCLNKHCLSRKSQKKSSDFGWVKDAYAKSLKCSSKDAATDYVKNILDLLEHLSEKL